MPPHTRFLSVATPRTCRLVSVACLVMSFQISLCAQTSDVATPGNRTHDAQPFSYAVVEATVPCFCDHRVPHPPKWIGRSPLRRPLPKNVPAAMLVLPHTLTSSVVEAAADIARRDSLAAISLTPPAAGLRTRSASAVTDSAWATLADVPSVTAISLCGIRSDDERPEIQPLLRRLQGVDRIVELDLSDTAVGNQELDGILPTSLKRLNISGTHVSSLECLRPLHDLEWVSLDGLELFPADFAILGGLRRLQFVGLRGCRTTSAGLMKLAESDSLTGLDIVGVTLTAERVEAVAKMSRLSELHLGGAGGRVVGADVLRPLNALTELRRVELFNLDFASQSGLDLRSFRELTQVRLFGCIGIGGMEIGGIRSASQLKEISLAESGVPREMWEAVGARSGLISLELDRITGVEFRGVVEALGTEGTATIQNLAVSGGEIGDDLSNVIAQFRCLRVLSLFETSVSDVTVKEIVERMPELEQLSISGSQIGDASLLELHKCRKLWSLGIADCPKVGQLGFQRLSDLKELVYLRVGPWGYANPFCRQFMRDSVLRGVWVE